MLNIPAERVVVVTFSRGAVWNLADADMSAPPIEFVVTLAPVGIGRSAGLWPTNSCGLRLRPQPHTIPSRWFGQVIQVIESCLRSYVSRTCTRMQAGTSVCNDLWCAMERVVKGNVQYVCAQRVDGQSM